RDTEAEFGMSMTSESTSKVALAIPPLAPARFVLHILSIDFLSSSPPTGRSLFDYAKLKQAHILELEYEL
ncbi:hypothetical protein BC826DRAFT_1051957, partial [Russula brevipes]